MDKLWLYIDEDYDYWRDVIDGSEETDGITVYYNLWLLRLEMSYC